MKAINLNYNKPYHDGTAYYRLDDRFMEILKKCEEKHEIIGFDYEPGNRNFGIILKKEEE